MPDPDTNRRQRELDDSLMVIAAARIAGPPRRGIPGWFRDRRFDRELTRLRRTGELFDQAGYR